MTPRATRTDRPAGLLDLAGFGRLLTVLRNEGYTVIGPTVDNGAVSYREIQNIDDLPAGWGSRQDAGHYRLEKRRDSALFGYVSGVQSWKRYLFPPSRTLWRAEKTVDGFAVHQPAEPAPQYAFLGVRACEIAGMELQDRVFLHGEQPDPDYTARRDAALVIAVQCTEAGETCFCASMQTGPAATGGYDLALTELIDEDRHVFLVEIDSQRGEAIALGLPLLKARNSDRKAAAEGVAYAAASMGRRLETDGLKDLIQANQEHGY